MFKWKSSEKIVFISSYNMKLLKMGLGRRVTLLTITVLVFAAFYVSQDHHAEATSCAMTSIPIASSFNIPIGGTVKFEMRGWADLDTDPNTTWTFWYKTNDKDWTEAFDTPLRLSNEGAFTTNQGFFTDGPFNYAGEYTIQFFCSTNTGYKEYSDIWRITVGTPDIPDIPPVPPDDPFVPTLIAMVSVTIAVGAVAGAVGKIVKSKKSSTLNKTKEKVPYDSSKGAMPKDYGTTPKLLRKPEKKTKTLWVEPPSPEIDSTIYDNADEIFTPTSALEFTEYVSKHWDRLQRADWEKYFENVGNCIIEKGSALHTTEALALKAREIMANEMLGKIEYKKTEDAKIDLSMFTEYTKDSWQLKDVKGLAKVLAFAFFEDVVKNTPNATPLAFIKFLDDYFEDNIIDSYSCLWASFKKLPVNSRPDNSINMPDQPDTSTGWKGV